MDHRRRRSAARSNPFANLLLMGRLYYAFTPHGFATSGFVASAFVGGGGGQIEPKPALPSNEIRSGRPRALGRQRARRGARRVRRPQRLPRRRRGRAPVHVPDLLGGRAPAGGAARAPRPAAGGFLFNIDTTVFLGFHL
ncbi:MAG: hypothetical protein IPN17_12070 [Deltaproteobacteria bacterium]|nr:hypothetical protein [Deltaproteobacteria bacterium]